MGLKLGAKVVPGSFKRVSAVQQIDFVSAMVRSNIQSPTSGIVPDTFTDANDIEVIVEGRLGGDGVFHATEVFAKCGSRYEDGPKA